MAAQHTPGPWHIESERLPRIFDEFGTHLIAVIHGADEQEKQADAALIAAAPDLLIACEAMINGTTPEFAERYGFSDQRDAAVAVIAKARGTQ